MKSAQVTDIDNEYTTRSGVFAMVSDKISVELDAFGQYEYRVSKGLTKGELEVVSRLDSLQNADEDIIGARLYGGQDGVRHDDVIGYYVDLYCGYVAEGDFRSNGTSGGLATWILTQLLQNDLIDGVVSIVKSEADDVLYEYGVLRTAEEIKASSKSKYYPMEMSKVLKYVRDNDGRYAIVGIPSFISDIRRLQGVDKVFAERIKFTVSLLAGHQKTTKYGEAIAFQAGIDPGDIKEIDFRHKVESGAASDYITEIMGRKDGQKFRILRSPRETFVGNWGAGMFKVKFSDYIDDCFGETADITLGDAWLPQYSSDGKGTSVIVVRDERIAGIIKDAMEDKRLVLDRADANTVKRSQRGMIRQYRDELNYRLSRARVAGKVINKRITPSRKIPFLRKIVQDLRIEISEKSKVHYREATRLNSWNYFEKQMSPLVKRYKLVYKAIHIRDIGFLNAVKRGLGRFIKR